MTVVTVPIQDTSQSLQLQVRPEEVVSRQYSVVSSEEEENQKATIEDFSLAPDPRPPTPVLVGRDTELAHLHKLLDKTMNGDRQIVFVTGEPGIGKTTLVDAFLAQIRDRDDICITSGQCVEQYGAGEAYLPLLEATMRLCRGPRREQPLDTLQRYAPTWLVQVPALLDPEEHARLQARVQGASRERMLREMAEAAEQFSQQQGFVIVLEDLHWSDVATLEWVSYMARRREPAKFMILGTYRPIEMLADGSRSRSIVQELSARDQCVEVRVARLGESVVQDYVTRRCGGATPPKELTASIHRRTEGNPLFLRAVVDYLCAREVIRESDGQWQFHTEDDEITTCVPDTLRQLIESQLERTSTEVQQILAVASVVGVEFTVAEVAAGLQSDIEVVELPCERLAQAGLFLRMEGVTEWPDGTLSGRYSFLHAVYREVIAARVSGIRHIQWHRRVAERKEVAYGERVGEIAAELAVHFEQGRDLSRAVHYLITAGETAMQRNAHQEAIAHFTHGLELLVTFPDTPERKRQELALQVALGAPLLMTKGYAAPEVAHAYGRARELCQQIGEQPDLFPTLVGLGSYYLVHGELPTARELTEQCVRLAEHAQDPALLAAAYFTYGVTLFYQGELTAAQATLAQGSRFYTSQASGSLGVRYGQDPGVACHGYGALTAWLLGYPDQALGKSHEALTLARQLSHSYSLGFALHTAGWLHQYRQDRQQLQEYAEEVMRVSQEEGFALWLAVGMILRGWVLSQHGEEEQGLAQMQEGLPTFSATGAKLAQPYHIALLAQARGKSGQPQEGLALLDQAFEAVDKTGERYYEAELYRLKGTLALQKGARDWELETGFSPQQAPSPKPLVPREVVAEVEGYFHKALDIARRQEAKSLELRAATSLARLWQQQDKVDEARELLQEIYHWFTEGFETKDLQAAETLLVSLGGKAKSPESKARSPKSKKAEGTSSLSPYSLQPIAYSLPQPSVLGAQSLSSLVPNTQHLAPNTFYNEGEYWSVSFAGETCRLKDARGLHYIAQLLQQPHQEIHVITLITVGADGTEQDMETPSFHDPSVSLDRGERFGDAGAMLDPQARAAYKQRLSELREELAEAQRFHDLGRSEHLAAEIDFLTHELSSAIGLGGRARHMGSHAERARVNITRSIKIALRKISEHHPVLGQHLATTLKTGAYCSYTPDKRMPIVWLG